MCKIQESVIKFIFNILYFFPRPLGVSAPALKRFKSNTVIQGILEYWFGLPGIPSFDFPI